MLSRRAARNVVLEDIPWRSAPGGNNRYDANDNPNGVVVFGTAENVCCLIHEELANFVEKKSKQLFPEAMFTYRFSSSGGPRFPKAMAAHINRNFYPVHPIEQSNVVTASSLTAIHEMLGFSIGDANDGILTIPPVYGRFELDFGNKLDMKIVYAEMGDVDPFTNGDQIVTRLKACLVKAATRCTVIKALLIVNPNNPLGRCYPPATLRSLLRFAQEYGLHFISDEVYALSVFRCEEGTADADFTSVLSIETTSLIDPSLVHVLYGMSKDFGSAGLRLGCLITRNALLRRAMLSNSRFHGPSGPSIAIATAILEDQIFVDELMSISRQRLEQSRQLTVKILRQAGIQWHKGGHAGFFVYIDLSPWLDYTSDNPEFALAAHLLEAGVGLHPREEHYEKPGWFRLVYSSMKPPELEEGLRRLVIALDTRTTSGCSLRMPNETNGKHFPELEAI